MPKKTDLNHLVRMKIIAPTNFHRLISFDFNIIITVILTLSRYGSKSFWGRVGFLVFVLIGLLVIGISALIIAFLFKNSRR